MRYQYRSRTLTFDWARTGDLDIGVLLELRPDERILTAIGAGSFNGANTVLFVMERALEEAPEKRPVASGRRGRAAVSEPPTAAGKSPEAVALGARGGRARARKLTPEQLSEIGRMGGKPTHGRKKK